MQVKTHSGFEPLDESKVNKVLIDICKNLPGAYWNEIAGRCKVQWYDGITTDEIAESTINAACSLIEDHPDYDFAAARLLIRKLSKECTYNEEDLRALLSFDVFSTVTIDYSRDLLFRYQGVRILYDRYLLRNEKGELLEDLQTFWLRVACGLVINEKNPGKRAQEFYDVMSQLKYIPSTPTLFNSGLKRPQMSSCYVQHVGDSLYDIFDAYSDMASLAKYAGGIGTNWTSVRASGSYIAGTNGKSTGLVPWLKIQDSIAVAVNQGGKRRGSHCAYIEPWHADIEQFLELRKPVGDDRRRTHDLDTALWIPDLFMERVVSDGDWTLFCPKEAPELADTWGTDFELNYQRYEQMQIGRKTIKARDLWRKILTALFETGHPWLCFKDACNRDNPMRELGLIRSSNLCTEITLNTSEDETAVCNLGSLNLGRIKDRVELKSVVNTAIRMLDNVIDINFYPTEKSRKTNLANRPIGLGVMGWQDYLFQHKIAFDSDVAKMMCQDLHASIYSYAWAASKHIATEKGEFPNRSKSTHKAKVRNSHVTAIAPTVTISNIAGASPSIEPLFSNLFVQSNMSGEFTNINSFLVADLIKEGLWNEELKNKIKVNNGSIQNIKEIPQPIRELYPTAFELPAKVLVDLAAERVPYISQSQSLNLYAARPTGKELSDLYVYAWKKGLKTTYYLRTLGATTVEKSTIDPNKYGKTITQQCKIDDPGCESCQ